MCPLASILMWVPLADLWVFQIRDRQLASGMGKPMMIDERYCDVGDLTLDDFVDGEPPETSYFIIELVKFAKLVTEVVHCRFTPTHTPASIERNKVRVHLALQKWHASLHPSTQYESHPEGRNRFALILSLVYHHQTLLLHRPSLDNAKLSPDQRDFSTQLAFYSAERINDLAGDILNHFKVNEFPAYV